MTAPTASSTLNNPSHSTLHNFHVDAKMFGATGDGVTDDTAAISAAIAAIKAAGSGLLFVPRGLYLRSGVALSLTGAFDITILGTGPGSRLEHSGAATRMFQLGDGSNAANDFTGKLTVCDLFIDGNAANLDIFDNTNVTTRPGRVRFERLRMWDFGTGTAFKNPATDGPSAEDCSWVDVKTSYGGSAVNLRIPTWTFQHCMFDHLTAAIKLYGNSKLVASGCVFSGNVNSIQFAEAGVAYANSHAVDGCWFENDTDAPITSVNASNQIDLSVRDTRLHHSGSYHAYFDATNSQIIFENVTFGGLTPKVFLRASSNALYSVASRTWNAQGNIVSPFNTTRNYVGPQLLSTDTHTAAPVTDTYYQVQGCKGIHLTSSGGTGVAITINDRALGDPIAAGATITGLYLPAGHWVHFGAFSVAPTVHVWPD